MPDAPKNSADDEAMLEALNRWTGFPRGEIKRGFMAGWRAAMAEVKKSRAMGAEQARRASRDAQLEKLNAKIDNFGRGWDHSREGF